MDRDSIHEFISRPGIRQLLIKQLQLDIIEDLFINGHFSTEEYHYITSHRTLGDKVVSFLDHLPSKTEKAYAAFMEFLLEWYDWIFEEYRIDFLQDSSDENRIKKILNKAEVPYLPLKHVSRKDELNKLINYLHSMQRGEYVVVHGMGGCGKSTLVNEALRRSPSLVLDAFKEKIFWLRVGRESAVKKEALNESTKKLLTIQQELYMKLFTPGGYSSPPLPRDNEEGKRRLKEKLSESDFEECLLILDEVPSSNFIECLNIGCKILVTTDNQNIMDSIRSHTIIHFLRVSEGFTEDESMALFSKNLNCDATLLSRAKYIHALCKGFPLTISLIASQLADYREDVLKNPDRWNECVANLKDKNIKAAIGRNDQYRQDQLTLLYKALEMSIDSLTPQLREYYQDFALFMDDVNIKPEVLSTLWNISKIEVENNMTALETKCLVIRTWNGQLSSYVYCIHDLLLDYLKQQLSENELQALHQKLIARYREKFGNDIANYPRTDNYIFLYLGYHLKEANYLKEFPELYFNLKFIETKILIHGAADVLYDFKKYKDYITNTEENFKIYEELYNFISRIGICRVLSSSDIVQFALAEPKDSRVYKMGIRMAKNSDRKYFEYLTEVPKDCSSPDVHLVREKITAAIFTANGDVILANANNLIKVINIKTHLTIQTFQGHDEKITRLVLSSSNLLFLSASEGCIVKVWSLSNMGNAAGSCDKPRTPSPSLTQKAWTDHWAQQRTSADQPIAILQKHGLPITDAQFSPISFNVVTASKDTRVIIWKLARMSIKTELKLTLTISREIKLDEVVVSNRFSPDEKQVVCAAENKRVWIFDSVTGAIVSYFYVDFIINSIALVPAPSSFEIIVLGENYKALYSVSNNAITPLSRSIQYSTLSRRRSDECIYAAISNDGKYIALAPTFYCIVVKEVKTDTEVVKFHETNGKISGISWSYDGASIMTTYESKLFKVWHLPKSTDNKIVKLKASVFDAAWIIGEEDQNNPDDILLVTAVLDTEYNINIYHDLQIHKKISKPVPDCGDICQLCVCPVNGYVIYACKDGTVAYVDCENTSSYHFIDKISCHKVLKLKVFSHGTITAVLLLVEKLPRLFELVGWYNDQNSENSNYLGNKVIYLEDESIIDFNVDFKRNNDVYVAKVDHTFNIYDLKNGAIREAGSENGSEEDHDSVGYKTAKFADFSPSFRFMCSGNDSELLVTKMTDHSKCDMEVGEEKPTVCKFSHDDKYIAVGFASGLVRVSVYDTVAKKDMEFKHTSAVFDLTWSTQDNRLLVILDREIALFDVSIDGFRLISIIYLSVDKVVMNNSFSRIVTVDNGGHFHVLKSPV